MLILECSQECYGRTDGSVTISLHNFVGEGITKNEDALYVLCKKFTQKNVRNSPLKNISLDYIRFNNPDLYLIVRTIVLRF
jgi:glutamine cyclotransferase